MQRTALILACFFIPMVIGSVNCFAQQYPFVQYTPKDGLISNMIKNIYQDSKGRLYFTSIHGLSVYDGSKFINYDSKNGLSYGIVNCIMEMGDDSIWVVTNTDKINCLVNGKMKLVSIPDYDYIINNLCKDAKGDIYAVAEEGLLVFNKDRFIKLPFIDTKGEDASTYTSSIFSFGDYLLVQRDNSMLPVQNEILYLYNKITKQVTAEMPAIYATDIANDGRIWVSTETKIMSLDTTELKKGKFVLHDLQEKYAAIRNKGKYFLLFDDGNNCWLGNQNSTLIKLTPDGEVTTFNSASGLNTLFVSSIFQDKEGITWIATNNSGVRKLVHTNFSHIERPFGITYPSDISYNRYKDELMLYSFPAQNTAVTIHGTEKKYLHIKDPLLLSGLKETPYGFFGIDRTTIYKLEQKGNILYPKVMLSDSSGNLYPNFIIDKHGNLIVSGKYNLTAIISGKIIFRTRLPFFADIPAVDSKGNIWIATRASDLVMYQTHPDDPSHYLEQKLYFKKELLDVGPRSLIIDKNDNIWIGTRNHGIQVYGLNDRNLVKKFSISTASGLSDEFITHLICDGENNIWASSVLGLDKITIKNGIPVIENITRQNNIYQSVFAITSDKENNVWGLLSNGVVKITPEKKEASGYSPTLMVTMLKAGKDTVDNRTSLSHKQNNLSFNFTATSFLNEKQVMYSYRLLGGTNDQWSEPSNNATVSFIDLRPGDYSLDIKANFPAGRYSEQNISYKFSITPAWWQTWWFRSIVSLFIVTLLVIGFRFYYRRKMEKRMAMLEKQKAIEKERTRIATDMHDDLGAGLSRIKFLSETIGIKKQQQQPFEDDIIKIREYSHEMIDKMGEIVWALNEKNDSLNDLISYIRVYAAGYLSQNGINCKIEVPDNFPTSFVSGEFRRNVYLTIKEALHNVVKHSQATSVIITIKINDNLVIIITDNGIGLDKKNIRPFSNGLTNMENRIKEIQGDFVILNESGTTVKIVVPLQV